MCINKIDKKQLKEKFLSLKKNITIECVKFKYISYKPYENIGIMPIFKDRVDETKTIETIINAQHINYNSNKFY